ncbi:uncharacterized protein BJ171DRAFT_222855 [Polychytrium aggregatum]|uniref:uncharacterized protein n=1 Tax=Polychytrium aggregatum TaxID=110093 RepID=UPI0022FECF91|nr:uncharacterized protein BJ171DRAFT_222855 [Polychytrium aggregatum]KAI9197345.1 hypothetical protein BJ171DRAFT_222855 [Polychytrium aggregatum]
MSSIKQFLIVPDVGINNSELPNAIDPNRTFQIEAGWGVPAELKGRVRLHTTKTLKDVTLTVDLIGRCETVWVSPKAKTDPNAPAALVSKHQTEISEKVFLTLTETLKCRLHDKKENLVPNEFGGINIPFTINLPSSGVPSSYKDACGCILYELRAVLTWQEGLKIIKTTREVIVPVTILMPLVAQQRLLAKKSEIVHESPIIDKKCRFSVKASSRVLRPNDKLFVDFTIFTVPPGQSIFKVYIAVVTVVEYRGAAGRAAELTLPNPIAVHEETNPVSNVEDTFGCVLRSKLLLNLNATGFVASNESALVSIKSFLRGKIFLSNNPLEPSSTFDVPVVLVPTPEDVSADNKAGRSNRQSEVLPPTQPPFEDVPRSITEPTQHNFGAGSSNNSGGANNSPVRLHARPSLSSLSSSVQMSRTISQDPVAAAVAWNRKFSLASNGDENINVHYGPPRRDLDAPGLYTPPSMHPAPSQDPNSVVDDVLEVLEPQMFPQLPPASLPTGPKLPSPPDSNPSPPIRPVFDTNRLSQQLSKLSTAEGDSQSNTKIEALLEKLSQIKDEQKSVTSSPSLSPASSPSLNPERRSSGRKGPAKKYRAVQKYVPRMSDEIALMPGDQVIIRKIYGDGWGLGFNVSTRQEGAFPLHIIAVMDEPQ